MESPRRVADMGGKNPVIPSRVVELMSATTDECIQVDEYNRDLVRMQLSSNAT